MIQPEGYKVDLRPLQFLGDYVDDIRREQEFQKTLFRKDQNQFANLYDDWAKQFVVASKDLPASVRSNGLASTLNQVKDIILKKGNTAEANQLINDQFANFVGRSAAYAEYDKTGDEIARELKDRSYDPNLIKSFISQNLFKIDPATGQAIPKDVSEIGDINEVVINELKANKNKYFNRSKGGKSIFGVTKNVKPAIKKEDTTIDSTGKMVTAVEYQTQNFPWTKAVAVKDPKTGQEYFKTVMDKEEVEIEDPNNPGQSVKVPAISEAGFRAFLMADEAAADAIEVGALDLIEEQNQLRAAEAGYKDDNGRPLDVTKIRNEDDFNKLIAKGYNLINPYDDENRENFGRIYLTGHPAMQQYVERVDVSVSRKKDAPPTVNVYNSVNTGAVAGGYMDSYKVLNDVAGSGRDEVVNGKVVGKSISGLPSDIQEYLVSVADDVGKRRKANIKYSAGDLVVKKVGNNVQLFEKNSGSLVSTITKANLNIYTNSPLGSERKNKAAGGASGYKGLDANGDPIFE